MQTHNSCPRAQMFKCKKCNDPEALSHHTLLCNKTQYRSSKFDNTYGRGGGRNHRGNGRGRGGPGGASFRGRGYNHHRFQINNSSGQSSHQMVPFGQYKNSQQYLDPLQQWGQSFTQYFQKSVLPSPPHQHKIMPNIGFQKIFQILHTFQSVMECNLYPSKKSILVLSDN